MQSGAIALGKSLGDQVETVNLNTLHEMKVFSLKEKSIVDVYGKKLSQKP